MENCVSIWLPTLTERYELIKTLEKNLNTNISIFNAIDGTKYIEEFKEHKHILQGQQINPGMIGCVLSHLEVLKNSRSDTTIFEDDCIFNSSIETLNSYISNAPDFDILCLDTSEIVESNPYNSTYVKITRFWGTHALLIKKEAAKKIIETFENFSKKNIFLPADWLYSYSIKTHNLKAYGPVKKMFDYKRGIYSVVANRVRF
jgi:GR25 family glycosyltransferase involved in LPS biosynthesis